MKAYPQNILIANSTPDSYQQLTQDLSGLALNFQYLEQLNDILDFQRRYPVAMLIIDHHSEDTEQLNLLFKLKSTLPTLTIFIILPTSNP